jgi:hypothetical protein
METLENATGSTTSKPDAALLAGAEALGAPAEPAPVRPADPAPAAAAPAGINWKREAREIFECVALLSIRFPSVKPVYDEPTLDRLSEAWAPVLQKHNLDFGKFAIYITAGLATLPVVKATAAAIRDDLTDEKAAASAAAKPPTAEPKPAVPA